MRVLLVSDIHSNIEALTAVIEAADMTRFDAVWCAGDVTGYGPNPDECVKYFLGLPNLKIVMGNHDSVISKVSAPIGFNPNAINAALKNIESITPESQQWLAELEPSLRIDPEVILVHGSPLDPDEYLLSLELSIPSLSSMAKSGIRVGLFGHTHMPAIYVYDKTNDQYFEESVKADKDIELNISNDFVYLVNPGSVGQPRDGDPRASFMELEILENRIIVRNRRVYYKIASCQEKMRERKYPEILINRLNYGC